MQEAQRNAPGKSRRKVPKKTALTETETATVQEEPKSRNSPVMRDTMVMLEMAARVLSRFMGRDYNCATPGAALLQWLL